jgi:signal transduction histidine kinase
VSRAGKVNTYHKAFGWTLILSFTIISMMLNGVHAVLTMSRDGGGWAVFAIALIAIMAPLSMLLTTHLLVCLIQDWSNRRSWLVRLRGVVAAVSGLIAVVSFVLSFAALRDMAILYGEMSTRLAWLVPLIIDAVILAATLAVVVAEAEMRLDREEVRTTPTIQSVVQPDDPAIRSAIQAPIDQAIHPDDPVDDVVDRADESQVKTAIHPVIHSDDPVDDVVDRADESQVKTAIHPVIHSGDPVDDDADDPVIHTVDDDLIDQAIHPGDPVDDDADDPAIHSAIHPVDDDLDRLADHVREALGTEADRETIRRALVLDREGRSRRRIAEEVGAAHSTVGRWIKAAERAESRPQLIAVD